MPDDALRDIMASVRARLQDELEAQLTALEQRHEQALADARRQIEADAEARWTAVIEDERRDAQRQVEAAATAAREELERSREAERTRLHADAEHRLEGELARVREEMAQALVSERQAAEARLQEERRAAAEQIQEARTAADRQISAAVPAIDPAILRSVRDIGQADSISGTLTALVRNAAERAGHAELYVADGPRLEPWQPGEQTPRRQASGEHTHGSALATEAVATRTTVRRADTVAAPLLLDGIPVAVLQAHGGTEAQGAWMDAVEALARHASAHLAYIATLRAVEAQPPQTPGRPGGAEQPAHADAGGTDRDAGARRFARLLVSEIKLYNEAAVTAGREHRDLMTRLAPEIEHARRVYEQRVPAGVDDRARHFHDELVQTLAGGDAALLGSRT